MFVMLLSQGSDKNVCVCVFAVRSILKYRQSAVESVSQ